LPSPKNAAVIGFFEVASDPAAQFLLGGFAPDPAKRNRLVRLARALHFVLGNMILKASAMSRSRRETRRLRRKSLQLARLFASRQILPPGKRS
jgi:hypothetical protein